MKSKIFSKAVIVLSFVSLFADVSSEMLYPVMPVYLKSIGFSVLFIGVLEGIAEATAGLSKGYFGNYSDKIGRRLPFVQIGYFLSSISKPLLVAFNFPLWVFFSRTIDRLGKGIRTGARDAILSEESTPETKGRVFGFHRSMDTLGAVVGPIIAIVYLYFYPENYKNLFFLAFIPGILSISLTFLIKDHYKINRILSNGPGPFSFFKYWNESPREYKKLVTGLLFFTLINSSDIFLLLKIKDAGFTDTQTLSVYIFYNLIYAILSFPLGALADKLGFKNVLVAGICIYSIVYLGMSVNEDLYFFYFLFFLYGSYAACTEGVSKAWISNIVKNSDTATAIGNYSGFQSICTMLASSLTGFVWFKYGAEFAFMVTGTSAIFLAFYFKMFINSPEKR